MSGHVGWILVRMTIVTSSSSRPQNFKLHHLAREFRLFSWERLEVVGALYIRLVRLMGGTLCGPCFQHGLSIPAKLFQTLLLSIYALLHSLQAIFMRIHELLLPTDLLVLLLDVSLESLNPDENIFYDQIRLLILLLQGRYD